MRLMLVTLFHVFNLYLVPPRVLLFKFQKIRKISSPSYLRVLYYTEMDSKRGNIMNRPIKQYNGRNETTSLVDHRNEEAKVNCKKQKLDQYYQTRRVNIYGSK